MGQVDATAFLTLAQSISQHRISPFAMDLVRARHDREANAVVQATAESDPISWLAGHCCTCFCVKNHCATVPFRTLFQDHSVGGRRGR